MNRGWRRGVVWLVRLAVVAGLGAGAWVIFGRALLEGPAPEWREAAVEKGPLVVTVSATGTVNAVTTVQVGSQVSGQISELQADFNSPVTAGQVIARLDPELLTARMRQARADLAVARAGALSQQAQLEKVRADLANSRAQRSVLRAQTRRAQVAQADAARDLQRRQSLAGNGYASVADRDKAQAALDTAGALLEAAEAQEQAQDSVIAAAEAQVRVAEAQGANAAAVVEQKEAQLQQAEIDLAHTVIRAPITGVVVSRNVDLGQTVAASLQAPILFQIARDLTRMQIDASVDEADIGRIREGQKASFFVDAYPGERFQGQVLQIRKAPQVVQNVVTYDVVISADNPDQKLLPGMTANLRILIERKAQVLKVPNAALRFRPQGVSGGPDARRPGGGDEHRPGSPGASPPTPAARVWIAGPGGVPQPVAVQSGASDGTFTEISGTTLEPGQKVILGPLRPPSTSPRPMGGPPRPGF